MNIFWLLRLELAVFWLIWQICAIILSFTWRQLEVFKLKLFRLCSFPPSQPFHPPLRREQLLNVQISLKRHLQLVTCILCVSVWVCVCNTCTSNAHKDLQVISTNPTELSSQYLVQFSCLAPGELLSGSGSGCGRWTRGSNGSCLAAGRNPFSVHHAAAFRLTQSYVFHFFVTHFHLHLYIFSLQAFFCTLFQVLGFLLRFWPWNNFEWRLVGFMCRKVCNTLFALY